MPRADILLRQAMAKKPFRSLRALGELVPEIVYVMCGARGEVRHPVATALPHVHFIGFEPDLEACELLQRNAPPGYSYYPAAIGKGEETRTLYVTRNPACSSLLKPNHDFFAQFLDCGPQIEVVAERLVETVSLNKFLPTVEVSTIDFLELDTQGTELDILRGADRYLGTSVVGVKTEAEFSPIYEGQALFADVDRYLRSFGFVLFDLSRSRYRRPGIPGDCLTRGQLLWGDALYLKDYRRLAGTEEILKLTLLAATLRFHDYALEMMNWVLREHALPTLPDDRRTVLTSVCNQYLSELRSRSLRLRAARCLRKLGVKTRIGRQSECSWVD